jgi:hypothetical protein
MIGHSMTKPEAAMIRPIAVALALLTLSACQVSEYYAEGQSIAARDRDIAICEAEALTTYPPRIVTRFTPRIFHPGQTTCDAAGNCVTSAGYWEGGQPYSEDLNEDLRARAITGCMGGRGYARVSLPVCSSDQPVRASTIMAPLTNDTCVIRSGGASMIVNP